MAVLLKLGTRRSLLALAQSRWVAKEIQKKNPHVQIELVGIETQGDRITDIPLAQVEGKEFFVKELDEALLLGRIDFTVHSLKDLSLDRPKDLITAAIPKRENPRDVILFSPATIEKLKSGSPLRIGSSAPRRLENIPSFLQKALPNFRLVDRSAHTIDWVEIRGNVHTRLARLQELPTSSRYLDGVVLALAGLVRLWQDSQGRKELEKLLVGIRWMVLPLKECPIAPGQGALAIECRKNDSQTLKIIQSIHDEESARHVSNERKLLAEWGGGCHQRFGATSITHAELGDLFFTRGTKPDGSFVEELRWKRPAYMPAYCVGYESNAAFTRSYYNEPPLGDSNSWFIAHSKALPDSWIKIAQEKRIWASGVSSWFKLASKGIWVEGCAEGLGFEFILSTLLEPVLRQVALENWVVITHESALKGWKGTKAVATYCSSLEIDEVEIAKLKSATHVFISSSSQYDALSEYFLPNCHLSCGPGKTAQYLKSLGLKICIFPSAQEWRKWTHHQH